MAIKLFPTSSNPQTAKHYSTIRRDIPVVVIPDLVEDEDFCACIIQCVPCLKMFTDTVGTDKRKNDFFSLFQNSVTGGSHEVYVVADGVESALISNNSHGILFNMTSCYGYQFQAKKIYDLYGYCEWYGILINKDSLGNIVQKERTPCFKLQQYTDRAANRTVRIETQHHGKLLHGKDYSTLIPVVAGKAIKYWQQQIRLPGAFFWSGSPIENDGIVLNSSQRQRMQILDRMTREYDLELDLLSSEQAMTPIMDYLFAEVCMVTDYNVYNFERYNNFRIYRNNQDFAGKIQKRKSFVIKCKEEFDNIEKTND